MKNIVENKHYKRWTEDEYIRLINAIKNDKMSHEDAGKLIGRTIGAVIFRLKYYIYNEMTYNNKTAEVLMEELSMKQYKLL